MVEEGLMTRSKSPDRPAPVDGAMLLLTSLWAEGVRRVYANIGTDYTAVVEAAARATESGVAVPELVLCQHEAVALSAAHGEVAASGRATAVFVHADVGTANLGGGLHNAARARVPVLIIAGLTPLTTRGERPGSRTSAVQFLQDVPDQAAIVRPYVRWSGEIRHGASVPQLVARALQVARSAPGGPVYLLAPREPLLETVEDVVPYRVSAVARIGPPGNEDLDLLAAWVGEARLPLVVTSSLGRDPAAVARLGDLAGSAGLGVCEVGPFAWTNVDTDWPFYLGVLDGELLAAADLVLAIDVDVPWVPTQMAPADACRVVHIDQNPVNPTIPLLDIAADLSLTAAAEPTLAALAVRLGSGSPRDAERRRELAPWRERFLASTRRARSHGAPGVLTPRAGRRGRRRGPRRRGPRDQRGDQQHPDGRSPAASRSGAHAAR
jgi:acetolactate synthase I/II/III large subunit